MISNIELKPFNRTATQKNSITRANIVNSLTEDLVREKKNALFYSRYIQGTTGKIGRIPQTYDIKSNGKKLCVTVLMVVEK